MTQPTIYLELPKQSQKGDTFHVRLDAIIALGDNPDGTVILVAPGHHLRTSMNRQAVLALMEKEANK